MSRGRPDSFSWDDVKTDKHRECYLGHSQYASVGRWQKGKDILWYTRGKASKRDLEAEKAKLKAQDRQAIAERLGLTSKKRKRGPKLNESEMKELLKRGDMERDESQAAERIDGLGASSARYHDGRGKADRIEQLKKAIAQGIQNAEQDNDKEKDGFAAPKAKTKLSATKMLEMAQKALKSSKKAKGGSDDESDQEERRLRKKVKKMAKKAKKKAKKEAKKAKKAAKKAEKEKRRRRHDSDDSDSA
eukprot:CAMPEP_0197514816 /NCGR_PEP_ID=MMETSP1318-20131121/141_1 /TAXON_ID=552666 /ORGANISM="Partenskyella glossopodia, Strain RCC365" /LENGTH=245 /DNA_ID=CAMNT_0043063017 /DNA_START=55 /DNA_END=792 /DNA_ORIENTATION=-